MFADFHFLRPYWFLALIPLAVAVWYLAKRNKTAKSWSQVCDPQLLPYIMNNIQSNRGREIPWPGVVAIALAITALAGPVWQRIPQPVFSNQEALVIILDLSLSMEATDISPNRLTRARHKISDILERRSEGQTALLVYAATPFVVSPLTDDSHNIASLVPSLTTEMMPAQGSRPMLAINKAVQLFAQSGIHHGDILLITDGWPEEEQFDLQQLGKHRLSILGVGTPAGAPIPVAGGGFFSDYNGAIVVPKLDSASLRNIVAKTKGSYVSLQAGDEDLDLLLATMQTDPLAMEVAKTNFTADRWHEEGPWLLLPVLVWAATTFRRQSLLIFFLMLPLSNRAHALDWDGLWQRPDQKGAAAFMAEKHQEAAKLFSDKQWKAAAHYRAEQYAEALASLEGEDSADATYNRGNILARLGRLPEAIAAYDQALEKDPNHADAAHNRKLVKKYIKKQQQNRSDKSNNSDDKDQDDKQEGQQKKQQGDSDSEENSSQQNSSTDSDQSSEDKKQSDQEQKMAKEQKQEANQANSGKEEEKADDEKNKQQAQLQKELQDAQKKASEQKFSQEQEKQLSEDQLKEEEAKMAVDQWLRRIPDDPGGLLRRKFRYQYQNSRRPTSGISKPW